MYKNKTFSFTDNLTLTRVLCSRTCIAYHSSAHLVSRVETEMHFLVFGKMRNFEYFAKNTGPFFFVRKYFITAKNFQPADGGIIRRQCCYAGKKISFLSAKKCLKSGNPNICQDLFST
jgi:hypothetical protein